MRIGFLLACFTVAFAGLAPAVAQTLADLTPRNLQVETSGASQWRLTWEHPANSGETQIVRYNVYRINEEANDVEYTMGAISPGANNSWTGVTLLLTLAKRSGVNAPAEGGFWDGEAFRFEVEGITTNGEATPRSAPVYYGTHPAPVVTALHTAGNLYVDVRWHPTAQASRGNNPVTKWEVKLYDTGRNIEQRREFSDRNNLRRVFMQLSAGEQWTVSVRGENQGGWGAAGETTVQTTYNPIQDGNPGSANHRIGNLTYRLTGPTRVPPGQIGEYTLSILRNNQPATDVYLDLPLGLRGPPHHRVGIRTPTSQGATIYEGNPCDFGTVRSDIACMEVPYNARDHITTNNPGDSKISAFSGTFVADFFYAHAKPVSPDNNANNDGWRHGDTVGVLTSTNSNKLGQPFYVGFKPFTRQTTGAPSRISLIWWDVYCEHLPAPTNYDACAGLEFGGVARRIEATVGYWAATPRPPRNITLHYKSNGDAVVSWEPAYNQNQVRLLNYVVEWEPLHTTTTDRTAETTNLIPNASSYSHVVPRPTALAGNRLPPLQIRVRGQGNSDQATEHQTGNWSEPAIAFAASPPASLRATAGSDSVRLDWDLPNDPEGFSSEFFEVVWADRQNDFHRFGGMAAHASNAPGSLQTRELPPNATSALFENLTSGTTYYFSVRAKGPGTFRSATSPTTTATPQTVELVRDLNVRVRGNRWVRVSWSVPSDRDTYPISTYRLERLPQGATEWQLVAHVPDENVEGFTFEDQAVANARSVPYTYRVITTRLGRLTDPESNRALTNPRAVVELPELDVTGDDRITGADVLTLYYSLAIENLDAENDDAATLRRIFLGGLNPFRTDLGDSELQSWLDRAQQWVDMHGLELDGDLDGSGAIDEDDARILYYTYAFPELLGNGSQHSGLVTIRAGLVGTLLGTEEEPAADAASLAAVSTAYKLLGQ